MCLRVNRLPELLLEIFVKVSFPSTYHHPTTRYDSSAMMACTSMATPIPAACKQMQIPMPLHHRLLLARALPTRSAPKKSSQGALDWARLRQENTVGIHAGSQAPLHMGTTRLGGNAPFHAYTKGTPLAHILTPELSAKRCHHSPLLCCTMHHKHKPLHNGKSPVQGFAYVHEGNLQHVLRCHLLHDLLIT